MKEKVTKYNILIWYLAALIFTGGLLCLHFIWKNAGDYSISFTQLGPMFASFLFICIAEDKVALSKIQNGLSFHMRDIAWYVLAAVASFALIGISSIILTMLFNNPYRAWDGSLAFYLVNFVAILFGSIGEEIGWRGYLLPTLNKRFTPFLSSIIVGCLWGFWHLNYASDIIFWLLFIVTTIELSIIFTFILYKSKGSLWTVIIFHAFFNFANRIFVWERFNSNLLLIEVIVFGLCCVVIAAADKNRIFKKSASIFT